MSRASSQLFCFPPSLFLTPQSRSFLPSPWAMTLFNETIPSVFQGDKVVSKLWGVGGNGIDPACLLSHLCLSEEPVPGLFCSWHREKHWEKGLWLA